MSVECPLTMRFIHESTFVQVESVEARFNEEVVKSGGPKSKITRDDFYYKHRIEVEELLNEWWLKQTDDLKKQLCATRMIEIEAETKRIKDCLEDIQIKEAQLVAGAQYRWNS